MFNNWPYTNLNELNLDWILEQIKGIKDLDNTIAAGVEAVKHQEEISLQDLDNMKMTIVSAINGVRDVAIVDVNATKTNAINDISIAQETAEGAIETDKTNALAAIAALGATWDAHYESLIAEMPADLASLTQTLAILGRILTGESEQTVTFFMGDYAGGAKTDPAPASTSDVSTNMIIGGAELKFAFTLDENEDADTKIYAIRWFEGKNADTGVYTDEHVVSCGNVRTYNWTVPDTCYGFSITLRNSDTQFTEAPASDIATLRWYTTISDFVSVDGDQDFTDEQKAQGRGNIGAASDDDVTELKSAFDIMTETEMYAVINGLKGIGAGLQIIDASKISTKEYWNSIGKVVTYTGSATLGVYPAVRLPAGDYYVYGEQTAFSWVRNVATGVITQLSTYVTNTHDVHIEFAFDLMLTKQDGTYLRFGTNGITTNNTFAIYYPDGKTVLDKINDNSINFVVMADNAFNLLDLSYAFHTEKYWNSSLELKNSSTWGCYDPITLKAGSYAITNYGSTFTFVQNLSTGEVSPASDYISSGILTVGFDFKLYISYNSTTAVSVVHTTKTNRYVEVGPYSEYKTITAAINATNAWDTIYVHSGTYTEQLELWNKPRHLIGESRESTFIVDHSGAYATPPIEMSEGTLSNFTVIEDGTQAAPDADMRAYCLHIEWAPQTPGSGLYVDNCTFINDIHSPLGCGMQADYTVKFENCSFFCNATGEETWERGSFYFHAKDGTDVTGQNIIAENCIIMSAANYAVYIGTPYQASGGSCRYRFSGCTIWSNERGTADNCVFIQTDSDTTITKMINSYGNTVAKLNSTQPNTPE